MPSPRHHKFGATFMVLLLFWTQVALAHRPLESFWASQSPISTPSSLSGPQVSSIRSNHLSGVSPIINSIDKSFGSVRNIFVPKSESTQPPVVLLIQDIHQNVEAQSNIARTIRAVSANHPDAPIFLEGADRHLDLSSYRSYSNPTALKMALDYQLRSKILSGPLYAALQWAKKNPVIGIEASEAYQQNIQALQRTSGLKKSATDQLSNLQAKIKFQKKIHFSDPLKAFDAGVQKFRSEEIDIAKYVDHLIHFSDLNADPHLLAFYEALRLEKSLDFSVATQERNAALESLFSRISKSQKSRFLNAGLNLRLGRISESDFYGQLETLFKESNVSLANYPQFWNFIQYARLADSIEIEKVTLAVHSLEQEIYASLSQSNESKRIVALDYGAHYLNRLISLELTPAEWSEFKNTRALLPSEIKLEPLEPFMAFYEWAERRDHEMAENVVAQISGETPVSVLVAGGFHSDGLVQKLQENGITSIVFQPAVTRVEKEDGPAYLTAFAKQHASLDQLFHGEKLFLAPPRFEQAARELPHTVVGAEALLGTPSSQLTSRVRELTGKLWPIKIKQSKNTLRIMIGPVLGILTAGSAANGQNIRHLEILSSSPVLQEIQKGQILFGDFVFILDPIATVGFLMAVSLFGIQVIYVMKQQKKFRSEFSVLLEVVDELFRNPIRRFDENDHQKFDEIYSRILNWSTGLVSLKEAKILKDRIELYNFNQAPRIKSQLTDLLNALTLRREFDPGTIGRAIQLIKVGGGDLKNNAVPQGPARNRKGSANVIYVIFSVLIGTLLIFVAYQFGYHSFPQIENQFLGPVAAAVLFSILVGLVTKKIFDFRRHETKVKLNSLLYWMNRYEEDPSDQLLGRLMNQFQEMEFDFNFFAPRFMNENQINRFAEFLYSFSPKTDLEFEFKSNFLDLVLKAIFESDLRSFPVNILVQHVAESDQYSRQAHNMAVSIMKFNAMDLRRQREDRMGLSTLLVMGFLGGVTSLTMAMALSPVVAIFLVGFFIASIVLSVVYGIRKEINRTHVDHVLNLIQDYINKPTMGNLDRTFRELKRVPKDFSFFAPRVLFISEVNNLALFLSQMTLHDDDLMTVLGDVVTKAISLNGLRSQNRDIFIHDVLESDKYSPYARKLAGKILSQQRSERHGRRGSITAPGWGIIFGLIAFVVFVLFLTLPARSQSRAPPPANVATANDHVTDFRGPIRIRPIKMKNGMFVLQLVNPKKQGEVWRGKLGVALQPVPGNMTKAEFVAWDDYPMLYRALLPKNGEGIDPRKYPNLKRLAQMPGPVEPENMAAELAGQVIRTYGLDKTARNKIPLLKELFRWAHEEHGLWFTVGAWDPSPKEAAQLARDFGREPWILFFDLFNEINYVQVRGEDPNFDQINSVVRSLKSALPNDNDTVMVAFASQSNLGPMRVDINKSLIDFVGITIYNQSGDSAARFVTALQKSFPNKPVIVAEFGFSDKDSNATEKFKDALSSLAPRDINSDIVAPIVLGFEWTDEQWKKEENDAGWKLRGNARGEALLDSVKNWRPLTRTDIPKINAGDLENELPKNIETKRPDQNYGEVLHQNYPGGTYTDKPLPDWFINHQDLVVQFSPHSSAFPRLEAFVILVEEDQGITAKTLLVEKKGNTWSVQEKDNTGAWKTVPTANVDPKERKFTIPMSVAKGKADRIHRIHVQTPDRFENRRLNSTTIPINGQVEIKAVSSPRRTSASVPARGGIFTFGHQIANLALSKINVTVENGDASTQERVDNILNTIVLNTGPIEREFILDENIIFNVQVKDPIQVANQFPELRKAAETGSLLLTDQKYGYPRAVLVIHPEIWKNETISFGLVLSGVESAMFAEYAPIDDAFGFVSPSMKYLLALKRTQQILIRIRDEGLVYPEGSTLPQNVDPIIKDLDDKIAAAKKDLLDFETVPSLSPLDGGSAYNWVPLIRLGYSLLAGYGIWVVYNLMNNYSIYRSHPNPRFNSKPIHYSIQRTQLEILYWFKDIKRHFNRRGRAFLVILKYAFFLEGKIGGKKKRKGILRLPFPSSPPNATTASSFNPNELAEAIFALANDYRNINPSSRFDEVLAPLESRHLGKLFIEKYPTVLSEPELNALIKYLNQRVKSDWGSDRLGLIQSQVLAQRILRAIRFLGTSESVDSKKSLTFVIRSQADQEKVESALSVGFVLGGEQKRQINLVWDNVSDADMAPWARRLKMDHPRLKITNAVVDDLGKGDAINLMTIHHNRKDPEERGANTIYVLPDGSMPEISSAIQSTLNPSTGINYIFISDLLSDGPAFRPFSLDLMIRFTRIFAQQA